MKKSNHCRSMTNFFQVSGNANPNQHTIPSSPHQTNKPVLTKKPPTQQQKQNTQHTSKLAKILGMAPKKNTGNGVANIKKKQIDYSKLPDYAPRPEKKVFRGFPLSKQQQKIFDYAMEGKNIFFSGCAGTGMEANSHQLQFINVISVKNISPSGKSYLLTRIKEALAQTSKIVYFTAPTGIAAVQLGGCTLHRWAGIGISKDENVMRSKAKTNAKTWKETGF